MDANKRKKSPTGSKVFISHSSTDKPFVRKLIDDLATENIPVWFDEQEIKPGNSIVTRINEAFAEVNYMLLIHSESSAKSKWVKEEIAAALYQQVNDGSITILVAKLDNTKLIPFLEHRLFFDFRDYENALLTRRINTSSCGIFNIRC